MSARVDAAVRALKEQVSLEREAFDVTQAALRLERLGRADAVLESRADELLRRAEVARGEVSRACAALDECERAEFVLLMRQCLAAGEKGRP